MGFVLPSSCMDTAFLMSHYSVRYVTLLARCLTLTYVLIPFELCYIQNDSFPQELLTYSMF